MLETILRYWQVTKIKTTHYNRYLLCRNFQWCVVSKTFRQYCRLPD